MEADGGRTGHVLHANTSRGHPGFRLGALFLALLALARPATGRDEPLTVEKVFEGNSLTRSVPSWEWRPATAELVRVRGDGARRALVALDPVGGAERVLLRLAALDELVPTERSRVRGIGRAGAPDIRWAPSGRALCAVVRGDLVWVDLDGGSRRRLTSSATPMADVQVAPDGRHVSFSRDRDLWVVPTSAPEGDGGEERRLTRSPKGEVLHGTLDWVYPEELGFTTAAWWSPDSTRLAFLSLDETGVTRFPIVSSVSPVGTTEHEWYPVAGGKNPVARVGVVSVTGGETTWLDLGSPAPEYVARVAWTPDGSRVAVVTLDRAQRTLRLLFADPATGASEVVLEETDPAWVEVPPAPRFLDARRFLWRSHRDGWTRWWLVTPGQDVVPWTPERLEADQVLHVDEARSRIVVSGTWSGGLRAGAYLGGPDVDGAVPAPFVLDDDRHLRASVSPVGDLVMVTQSDSTTPPRTEVRRLADGSLLRPLGDARSRSTDSVRMARPEFGRLASEHGPILWCLWKPPRLEPGRRYPVIVQVYGGPGSTMVRDEWGRGPWFETLLTQKGFLVLEVDGRGTGGRGARYERLVQGRLGVPECEDQVLAVRELARRPYVDGDRVGIWGWSYGGTMVCNALCRHSDVFKAGVAVAPVTDWRNYDTIYTERYMGTPQENAAGYDAASCVKAATGMDGWLLLVHGLGDDNVHVQNTFQLVDALLRAKKRTFDVMVYPDAGHGIGGRSVDVFGRLLRWFETHLR
jgi:dipeptidyl-peptidase-4